MERPVLAFDGDCAVCSTSAEFVESRVRRRPEDFTVAPYQRLDLAPLGLTAEQCDAALQWVAADGRVRSAEDAVIAVLHSGRMPFPLLGALLRLPGVHRLAGAAYRWVARNRHRLPGGTPACSLPSP